MLPPALRTPAQPVVTDTSFGFELPETVAGRNSARADFGGRPLDAALPRPLMAAWETISGGVLKGIDLLWPEERPTPPAAQLTTPLARAQDGERALVDEHAFLGSPARFHNEGWKVWRTEAWPLGQVLHARVALAMSTGDWSSVDATLREFEAYRDGDGFVGGTGLGDRYYDDNEWIGLAAMQAYTATGDSRYLHHAERTFRMVETGAHPDGGMYWHEQDRSGRHTCSTAPAGELAMQLYEATGEQRYLRFASEQASWLAQNLRLPSGMYADAVTDAGSVNADTLTYNQGAPIGLDVQLYRATGDRAYLDRARSTADATIASFQGDRLWKQPPAFNAIFFRNLLALHAVAPDPRYVQAVDSYLDRVWSEARNPDTGLFDQGDIGYYYFADGPGNVLDQAAITQLFAIRALPPEQWATLT